MSINIFGREPALVVAAVGAIISVAVGFGLEWSGEQVGLVMAAVSAVIGVIVRSQVSPVDV